MLSFSEENHLKAIYHLSQHGQAEVTTNAIAEALSTKAASVSDMLKKLAQKKLIEHVKYQGVKLTENGRSCALDVIRKHRLWEVFLVEKLNFSWDEVHEVAEQLEHINSPLLTNRLDKFLGFPRIDPHGDPIPDEKGQFKLNNHKILSSATLNDSGVVVGVKDSTSSFLKYLDKLNIKLGSMIVVKELMEFDGSMEILVNEKSINISKEVANNIMISEGRG